MSKKNSTFEQKIGRLNEISVSLEKGDDSLENMLKYFEEGIKVYRECFEILQETESKITMILENDDKTQQININDYSES